MDALSVAPATFIVGHPRSGTSLLRALLDNHPDLLVLPFESHLFDWVGAEDPVSTLLDRTRLWATLQRHQPSISRADVEDVLTRAFGRTRDPRGRLLALVEGWRELTGARRGMRWVEKTPRHLYETSTFLKWFPAHGRILVMRRDPRDVMTSALKEKPSRTIFQMALTGRLAHQVLTEHERDARVSVVPYEGLVRDPEGTMQAVCRFLEVRYTPGSVTPTVLGAEYSGNSRFEPDLQGVSGAAVGRYRAVLSAPGLERAEALLAPVLSAGGYTASVSNSRRVHLVPGAAITTIVRSGLWRSRAVRSAFGGS
jgi:hypothetical protein